MTHVQLYNPRFGTARCTCGLFAIFRTTLELATEPFQEHVEKELTHPTDEITLRRAVNKPKVRKQPSEGKQTAAVEPSQEVNA